MKEHQLTPFVVVIVWMIAITCLGIFGKSGLAWVSLSGLSVFGVLLAIVTVLGTAAPWIALARWVNLKDISPENVAEESTSAIENEHREPGQQATSVNSQHSDTDKPDDYYSGGSSRG